MAEEITKDCKMEKMEQAKCNGCGSSHVCASDLKASGCLSESEILGILETSPHSEVASAARDGVILRCACCD
jgi:hypothetical protein